MAGEVTIQQQIFNLLLDERPHTKDEIRKFTLEEETASDQVVWQHMYNLRKIVRPKGEDIICFNMFGKSYYQYLRKIVTSDDHVIS